VWGPEWELLLRRQNAVVSRRQALRFATAKVLDWRIVSGRWQRAYRAVYVTHNGPLTEQQRLWAPRSRWVRVDRRCWADCPR
jgi:hypothetical protein